MDLDQKVKEPGKIVTREKYVGYVSSISIYTPKGISFMCVEFDKDFYDILKRALDSGLIHSEVEDKIHALNYVRYKLEDSGYLSHFSIPWETFVELGRPRAVERASVYTALDSE